VDLFVLDYLHSQYFWTGLAFLMLLGIISKFVLPSITTVLDARAQQVKADLTAAETARTEGQAVLADYQAQLAAARKESADVISRARAEAEALVKTRIAEVEAELTRKAEEARQHIAAAKQEALRDVQRDVAELALAAAKKLLHRQLDPAGARQLTDTLLAKGLPNA
jgi:F-type H+-transporting ATPase subunit b